MAGRGPLPERAENRRRRNKPTIPTTDLPAGGFDGPIPSVPKFVVLGPRARAWWTWAWRTPQAAAWWDGDVVVVARRASLEDDLAAIGSTALDHPPAEDASAAEWRLYARDLEVTLKLTAKLVQGSLAVQREMRELDDRLGLTPKATAVLRWKIVAPEPVEESSVGGESDEVSRRRREREERIAAANA